MPLRHVAIKGAEMNQKTVWVSVRQRANESALDSSTIWRHVKKGLLPEPVRLTPGTTRFARRELDAIDHARLAGADDEAIRKLVRNLVAARKADTEQAAA